MSTETPFSPRSIRDWNNLPSAATTASSVEEFRDTLGNLPPAQFRGGVQGHAGQLTTCPIPDRVDKIPACF